jgi:1-acyl-sn-glycerol-3-phosphate acyltransferase
MSRGPLDRLLLVLDRRVLRVFFREIEVVGLENVPSTGPFLLVSNHGNALVDAMLLYGFVPRSIRFLAKSTLWDHPVARYLVRLGGAIPVYRRQDIDADTRQNAGTFARAQEVLAAGSVIAIFPEGTSHDEPDLLPLKTGVARIALEAQERFGPLGLRVVPVGLNFEAPDLFRSRVLVKIGESIEVAEAPESGDGRERVRELIDEVEVALRRVTLNYRSWREAELLHCAAEVYARPAIEVPRREKLSDQFPLRKSFLAGYRELARQDPAIVADVFAVTGSYDRLLRRFRLEDRQVASSYPRALVVRFLVRSIWWLALWRPLAFVGVVFNWLPYKVPGWVTSHLELSTDQRATYKVLMSLVLFPLTWIAGGLVVSWWLGWLGGLGTLLLAPVSGYLALTFGETWRALRQESRAYLALKGRRGAAEELKRRRRAVYDEVSQLVRIYRDLRTTELADEASSPNVS